MKQPATITYLFGNVLTLLAAVLAALYAGYHALAEDGSGWVAIAAVIAASHCANCHRQLNAYGRWKREWESLERNPKSTASAMWRGLQYPLAVAVWLVGLVYSFKVAHDLAIVWAAWLFWLGTAIAICVVATSMASRVLKLLIRTRATNVVVCVVKPVNSSAAIRPSESLPIYCRPILTMDHGGTCATDTKKAQQGQNGPQKG